MPFLAGIIKTPPPPCKGCEERTEDCHGKCGRYVGWRAERDAAISKYKKSKETDQLTYDERKSRSRWRRR